MDKLDDVFEMCEWKRKYRGIPEEKVLHRFTEDEVELAKSVLAQTEEETETCERAVYIGRETVVEEMDINTGKIEKGLYFGRESTGDVFFIVEMPKHREFIIYQLVFLIFFVLLCALLYIAPVAVFAVTIRVGLLVLLSLGLYPIFKARKRK